MNSLGTRTLVRAPVTNPQRIPAGVRAIDVHVHPATDEARAAGGEYLEWAHKYFGSSSDVVSYQQLAERYRSKGMMAVLLGKDARTNTGLPPIPNESIAQAVRDHADTFLGFGSVDPHMGRWAVREIEHIADLGLRGLKFQQADQAFFPNDPMVYPLYEAAQRLGLVVLFHTGTTGIGAGAPGGMGHRLKYCQPIYIDDVAADFPGMTIIAAHPGWPWTSELIAIATHKANVFVDLSGWAPKYLPPELLQHVRTRLQDKVLFGTDWPLLDAERWESEFAAYGLPDDVLNKIMLTNAMRVLNLVGNE